MEYNLELDTLHDNDYSYGYIKEYFSSIFQEQEKIDKGNSQNLRIDFRRKEDKEQEIEK